MDSIIKGPVAVMGRNIDTDQIIAARYLTTSDPKELAEYLFEDCPDKPDHIAPGTIIVADQNFGSGSSREHAPIAMVAAGISAVLAESFARIFQRNAINIGLLTLEVPGISKINGNQQITLDLEAGLITTEDSTELTINPVPEFIRDLVSAGGLIPWIKSGGMK